MPRLLMLGVLLLIGPVHLAGQEPETDPATTRQARDDAAASASPESLEDLWRALRDAVAAADELSRSAAAAEDEERRDPFSATPAMRRLAAQPGAAEGPAQQTRISLPRVRGIAISQASGAAALLEFEDEQIVVREREKFSLTGSGGDLEIAVEQIASGVMLRINGQQHWIPVR